MEGQGPIAGYGFFYYNKPQFFSTNLTLRAAIAPIYLDAELGISHLLGEHTDLGIGVAGGGFADTYSEIRQGSLKKGESFTGDGGEVSASVYHLFNPDWRVPLYGIAKAGIHHSIFDRDSTTAPDFTLPDDLTSYRLRAGLRLGGREPTLNTPMAMEISVWYESFIRGQAMRYGFDGDREVERVSHLFWGRTLLKYTFEETQQYFDLSITGGFSLEADRFSAYRLGGGVAICFRISSKHPWLLLPGTDREAICAGKRRILIPYYTEPAMAGKLVRGGSARFLFEWVGTTAMVAFRGRGWFNLCVRLAKLVHNTGVWPWV